MSKPERRRPGARSSLLVPEVEAVRTAPVEEPEPARANSMPGQRAATEIYSVPVSGVQNVASNAAMPTVDKTYKLPAMMVRRAETAVLRSGAYTSMKAFVAGAMERELARLESEFNAGEEYPPNDGGFRIGRPLGS